MSVTKSDHASWIFKQIEIPGCFEISFPAHPDKRGVFVKTFQSSFFRARGFEADFSEMFYTVSSENVLRGMHVQLPPAAHAKFVYCATGKILDVTLDLRRGSPTYGKHVTIELSPEARNGVFLPRGIAHGFCVTKAPALVIYHVTSEHSPNHDTGIAWNSFGANWPTNSPVISARDEALPSLAQFKSPFVFEEHT
jgi:dTDP-4-dehydrorhamnose 3,5-epimerase